MGMSNMEEIGFDDLDNLDNLNLEPGLCSFRFLIYLCRCVLNFESRGEQHTNYGYRFFGEKKKN